MVSLAFKDGALSFDFLTGGNIIGLNNKVFIINLLDLLRRLYIGLI